MTENILVPMDRSEQSRQTLEYVIDHRPDADITVLHAYGIDDASAARGAVIVMDDQVREAAKQHATEIFEQAREVAAAAGYDGELDTIAEEGDPARVIADHASDFDAVFIGRHGRGSSAQILLGSVAEKVVRRAPVPVTVVK